MARSRAGNETGELGSGIARRAGAFLEINYAGASKDKRIARDLAISPSMAKQLRGGRGWTPARFDQLMALAPGFRDFVFPPASELDARLDRLADRFERLADELAELRAELRADRNEIRADIAGLRDDVRNLRGA